MTDISARQTFTTAENSRFSDYPSSADTPESGSCIEAHGLTPPPNFSPIVEIASRWDVAKPAPQGRENYPRQTNHIRAIRRPPGSPRVELGASSALLSPLPSSPTPRYPHPTHRLRPLTDHPPPTDHPAPPTACAHSQTAPTPPRCSQLGAQSHRRRIEACRENALNGPTTSFTVESAHVSEGRPRGPCGPKWKSTFFGAKNPPVAPLTSAIYSAAGACHRSPFPASTPGPPRALPRCAGDARRCAAKASRNRGTDRAPSLR